MDERVVAMGTNARIADDLAAHLRDRILDGGFPGGTQLAEQNLASEYDVARPTVRTALALLERDGLLHRKPHLPATVATVSADEIPDIVQLLEVTENLALGHILSEDPDIRQLRQCLNSAYAFLDTLVELSCSERLTFIHRRSTFELLLAGIGSQPTSNLPVCAPELLQSLLNAILLQDIAAAHIHISAIHEMRRQYFGMSLTSLDARA